MRCASQILRSATPSPVSAETMKVASNFAALSLAALVEAQQRLFGDHIDLVEDRAASAASTSASRRRISSASSSRPLRASISTPTRSASCAPLQAVVTMARSSRRSRRKNSGRIDEDQLRLALDRDAADQRARRLHLVRDDA